MNTPSQTLVNKQKQTKIIDIEAKNVDEFTLVRKPAKLMKVQIQSPQQAYGFCRDLYKEDIHIQESFYLVLLNQANITIGYVRIGQGGISTCPVDSRLVCKYAIESLATSVIICHNHPAGTLKPSKEDLRTTRVLRAALEMFNISLSDHIIVGDYAYFSFLKNDLL